MSKKFSVWYDKGRNYACALALDGEYYEIECGDDASLTLQEFLTHIRGLDRSYMTVYQEDWTYWNSVRDSLPLWDEEGEKGTSNTLQDLYEKNHLCLSCNLSTVCAAGKAAHDGQNLLITISGCLGHQKE